VVEVVEMGAEKLGNVFNCCVELLCVVIGALARKTLASVVSDRKLQWEVIEK
jgi:hypothetical protein